MIFESQAELRDRIEQVARRTVRGEVRVFSDTSNYMAILGGSVLRLAESDYFVLGDTREGRFGIEDQPKYWVKHVVDLGDGRQKIIKLVFYEQFTTNLGLVTIRCHRSPEKESAFLHRVEGHPRFMQGRSVTDAAGNLVRIIDFIRGPTVFNHVVSLPMSHERYFHEALPGLMAQIIPCIEALHEVHQQGLHHGDVRNDHILIAADTGTYTWIDFDYAVNFADYDIWCMGNIINYVVGKGLHTFRGLTANPATYPHFAGLLDEHDAVALFRYRIANLRKLFPYIPLELNDILMRFSMGAIQFYDSLESQARDLRAVFRLPAA